MFKVGSIFFWYEYPSDTQQRPFGPTQQWVNGNGLTQRLGYDLDGRTTVLAVSNRRNEAIWQQAYHYAPASNRLLGTSERTLVLDPAGNTLREHNDLQRKYRYNAQNRISEYHENGQRKACYHYNAPGQRIHKAIVQADGTEQHTLFHYRLQGELLGEIRLGDSEARPASQARSSYRIAN